MKINDVLKFICMSSAQFLSFINFFISLNKLYATVKGIIFFIDQCKISPVEANNPKMTHDDRLKKSAEKLK